MTAIMVSEPQVMFDITPMDVKHYVDKLRVMRLNPHEFATSYVHRTAELGYAPDLFESFSEFVAEKRFA